MTKPRTCDRKHCGEPGFMQAGTEFLCADHFDDWLRDQDQPCEFDEQGRNHKVMRHARAL